MAPNAAKVQVQARNHYDALGLDPWCTSADIKGAYQAIALEHHPDRLITLDWSEEEKKNALARFITANSAQEILLDEALRRKYNDEVGLFNDYDCSEFTEFSDDEPGDERNDDGEGKREQPYLDIRYPKAYQHGRGSADLPWQFPSLRFASSGWDIQVQLDPAFAGIVYGEITNHKMELTTLDDELHIFMYLSNFRTSMFADINTAFRDTKMLPTGQSTAKFEDQDGKSALSILITNTPQQRKLKALMSKLTWGRRGQDMLHIVVKLWHPSSKQRHEEVGLTDQDVNTSLVFQIDEDDHGAVALRRGGKRGRKGKGKKKREGRGPAHERFWVDRCEGLLQLEEGKEEGKDMYSTLHERLGGEDRDRKGTARLHESVQGKTEPERRRKRGEKMGGRYYHG